MSCSNCFNGCAEIVSDQCVRYTGIDVPILGIQNGDSLSLVEQSLITFLVSTLDGTGIKPNIDPAIICDLVKNYLPTCGDITIVDLFNALIKAACDLQTQIDAIDATLLTLNGDYTVGCLSGVIASSDTHAVLQAVITKLCLVVADLAALTIDLHTNYVLLADLDALIAAYINSIPVSSQYYTKMIPYTVVEYYGSLSNFNATGAGLAGLGWDKIYLCNGLNGTPDKRGRVPVGAIQTVPGGALATAVNPASSAFNPNYAVGDVSGANSIILNATQIPAHTHNAVVTEPPHHHTFQNAEGYTGSPTSTITGSGANAPAAVSTSSTTTGISIVNSSTGGGLAHSNTQPVCACYYIMYIP